MSDIASAADGNSLIERSFDLPSVTAQHSFAAAPTSPSKFAGLLTNHAFGSRANRLPAAPETARRAERRATRGATVIGAGLHWHRIGSGWRLLDGRRRFGEIIPDGTYPGMWRPVLSGGRLGDLANITWAKHAMFEAAVRELEWEGGGGSATAPSKCPTNRGVFEHPRPPSRSPRRWTTRVTVTPEDRRYGRRAS
jgi:hypothetical protein